MLRRTVFEKVRPCSPIAILTRAKIRKLPEIEPEIYIDENPQKPSARRIPGRIAITDFLAYAHTKDVTFPKIKHWFKWRMEEEMRNDQKYMRERHFTLGPDLAATHFLTYRGGKVKYRGGSDWVSKEDIQNGAVPSAYVPYFKIEELDASKTIICYEGLENFCNLHALKKLFLCNCHYIDDWCLSRFHLFANTLEYLDLSGCRNVSERGLATLHVLRQLKTLVINDMPNVQNKELVSLMLQDIIPECKVIGVNYEDPTLLKRMKKYMS